MELRADGTNSMGVPHMEEISFSLGISQLLCLLWVTGESTYNDDGRSIVEADLFLAWWRCCLRHLGGAYYYIKCGVGVVSC